jgi:hypothetical protein
VLLAVAGNVRVELPNCGLITLVQVIQSANANLCVCVRYRYQKIIKIK